MLAILRRLTAGFLTFSFFAVCFVPGGFDFGAGIGAGGDGGGGCSFFLAGAFRFLAGLTTCNFSSSEDAEESEKSKYLQRLAIEMFSKISNRNV